MVIIDWAQAPEGTTHAFETGLWRKVTDEAVYKWEGGGWRKRPDRLANWLATFPTAVGGKAQPKPAPKENPLPDGKVWFEHATYYNPDVGQVGLFFTEESYYWAGGWRPWQEYDFKYWSSKVDTTMRFPNGIKPQVKQEQPKKPVGWWS